MKAFLNKNKIVKVRILKIPTKIKMILSSIIDILNILIYNKIFYNKTGSSFTFIILNITFSVSWLMLFSYNLAIESRTIYKVFTDGYAFARNDGNINHCIYLGNYCGEDRIYWFKKSFSLYSRYGIWCNLDYSCFR